MKDIIVIAVIVAIDCVLAYHTSWQVVAVIVGVTFVAYRRFHG